MYLTVHPGVRARYAGVGLTKLLMELAMKATSIYSSWPSHMCRSETETTLVTPRFTCKCRVCDSAQKRVIFSTMRCQLGTWASSLDIMHWW